MLTIQHRLHNLYLEGLLLHPQSGHPVHHHGRQLSVEGTVDLMNLRVGPADHDHPCSRSEPGEAALAEVHAGLTVLNELEYPGEVVDGRELVSVSEARVDVGQGERRGGGVVIVDARHARIPVRRVL